MTISFVRAYQHDLNTHAGSLISCFHRSSNFPLAGAASFTIYTRTKEYCRDHNLFTSDGIFDVAASGGLGYVYFHALDIAICSQISAARSLAL